MQGKVCLITGATSGIGEATALELAKLGATVILVARDAGRGKRTLRLIDRKCGRQAHLLLADLSTRAAIQALAQQVRDQFARLDVLVNNVGILTRRREITAEGFERQFFVNHLGSFLLTNLLLDLLIQSAPARVVNVASTAHSRGVLDFDDLQAERGFQGWQMYANTKLANIVFTYELARRLANTGVTANCVHPGVVATRLARSYAGPLQLFLLPLARRILKNPHEGARTPTYVASAPELEGVTGCYFKDCVAIGTSPVSNDREVQRRLWQTSAQLVGLAPSAD